MLSFPCSHHLGWPLFSGQGHSPVPGPGPAPLVLSQASLLHHQPVLGGLLRQGPELPAGQQRHLHWLLASLKGLSSSSQL